MVWKKKKTIKLGIKKKVISNFGKKKKLSYKKFVLWEKRCLWNLKEFFKFTSRFKRKFIKENLKYNFYVILKERFSLNKPTQRNKRSNFIENFFNYPKFILDNISYNKFLKKWIFSLIKVLIKHGKIINSIKIVSDVLIKINQKTSNLTFFFSKIKKNMHLPLKLRLRVVAGRKIHIPVILKEDKEIMFILRIILSSIKNRSENNLKEKIFNELLDIFNNKGLSIKRKMQFTKELHDNLPNIRFLNF